MSAVIGLNISIFFLFYLAHFTQRCVGRSLDSETRPGTLRQDQPDQTVGDIILKRPGGDGEFDNDGSNFNIFGRLFRDAKLDYILDGTGSEITSSGKITLFSPNDSAMRQTAVALKKPELIANTSERNVYEVLKEYTRTFESPKAVLSSILYLHVTDGSYSGDALRNEASFSPARENQTFELIRAGSLFHSSDNRLENSLTLIDPPQVPCATLVIDLFASNEASNGFLHTIDYMMFPRMGNFPRSLSEDNTGQPSLAPIPSTPSPVPGVIDDGSAFPGNSQPSIPSSETRPTPTVAPSDTSPIAGDSPSDPDGSSNGEVSGRECFPSSATIHLSRGEAIPISDLTAGTSVLASRRKMSKVYLFTHKVETGTHRFVHIVSHQGHQLLLTPGHYLYADKMLKTANKLKIGDTLHTLDGPARIISKNITLAHGLIAPHTLHGDIVVNRILVSTYTAAIHPKVAHALLWPVRAVVHLGLSREPLGSIFYNGFDLHSEE